MTAAFSLHTKEQYVSIWWSWHEAGVPNTVYGICSGDIDTVFKPTAMDVAADGSLLVAGTNPKTGRMNIERWQLALPERVKDASSLDDSSIPPQARLSAPQRLLHKRTTVMESWTALSTAITGNRWIPWTKTCSIQISTFRSAAESNEDRRSSRPRAGSPGGFGLLTARVGDSLDVPEIQLESA